MTHDHSALLAQLDALKSADAGSMFAELIRTGLQSLIAAQATHQIGAGRYQRSPQRTTERNGHRRKTVSTTGVSIDGTREVLGTAVGDNESFEFWREFLASLKARGLSGVHLVISDAHAGLKTAVAQQFTGSSWQRCQVHFMRNLHGVVAAKHAPAVTAAIKTVFAHTEPAEVAAQWDQVADTLEAAFPKIAAMMAEARVDVVAFTAFPRAHWQKIWSNNPIERLNKEIKRRADVVEIFPNPAAFLRLATAVVIEAHDEWQVTRRYLSDISMAELRNVIAAKHAALTEPLAEQRQIA